MLKSHLERLEAEAIYIFREVVSKFERPVMLYSMGKDSSVLLHLAKKAFSPTKLPFPLLHVDTNWKFREMYNFRDKISADNNIELLIYKNPDAIAQNINPFDHPELHTDMWKTEGLKQALKKYNFDGAIGGARRDEEKSRAKERIFSFRNKNNFWDPKNQRPEFWNLYNTNKNDGESFRIFPLSNWTERDVWLYILQENIPIPDLYFAKPRDVVIRNNQLLPVDDERFILKNNEKIQTKIVRFRTLGCYPLTCAVESNAQSVEEIVFETFNSSFSERQGRLIDFQNNASMEKKKQEGYF